MANGTEVTGYRPSRVADLIYSYITDTDASRDLKIIEDITSSDFCYEVRNIKTINEEPCILVFYFIDNSDDRLLIKLTIQESELL